MAKANLGVLTEEGQINCINLGPHDRSCGAYCCLDLLTDVGRKRVVSEMRLMRLCTVWALKEAK
jgi:hypothetical protein